LVIIIKFSRKDTDYTRFYLVEKIFFSFRIVVTLREFFLTSFQYIQVII